MLDDDTAALLGEEFTGLGSVGDVGTLEHAVRALVVVVVLLGPLEIFAHGVAALVNVGEELVTALATVEWASPRLAEPAWLPGSNSADGPVTQSELVDKNDSRPRPAA